MWGWVQQECDDRSGQVIKAANGEASKQSARSKANIGVTVRVLAISIYLYVQYSETVVSVSPAGELD